MVLAELITKLAFKPDDHEAWAEFYSDFWAFVFIINFRLVRGQQELAEDISQEVFLRLRSYCPFHRFTEDPEAIKSYVAVVCRNTYNSYMRQIFSRDEITLDTAQEQLRSEFQIHPDLEDQVETDDLLRDLFKMLEKPKDRRLLQLLVDGYTLNEIAADTDQSYSSAGVQVHRLRKKLRRYLKSL